MNNVCNNARETLNRCLGLIFLLTKVVSLSKGGNSLLETFFFFFLIQMERGLFEIVFPF